MFNDSPGYSARRSSEEIRTWGRGGRYRRWGAGTTENIQNFKVTYDAETFIKNLVNINSTEIEQYKNEIISNKRFHQQIMENRRRFGRGFYGIGSELGVIVYIICRKLKPYVVVETGVSSGVSSSYILCALEENKQGKLFSIDLPWGEQSGWIIPNFLRDRWNLEQGKSSDKLLPLLEKVRNIDVFLHDSEHSYKNMLWEFQTAWEYLKPTGILLSHNVNYSRAFPDFCENVGVKGHIIADMGGIVKGLLTESNILEK